MTGVEGFQYEMFVEFLVYIFFFEVVLTEVIGMLLEGCCLWFIVQPGGWEFILIKLIRVFQTGVEYQVCVQDQDVLSLDISCHRLSYDICLYYVCLSVYHDNRLWRKVLFCVVLLRPVFEVFEY